MVRLTNIIVAIRLIAYSAQQGGIAQIVVVSILIAVMVCVLVWGGCKTSSYRSIIDHDPLLLVFLHMHCSYYIYMYMGHLRASYNHKGPLIDTSLVTSE